MLGAELQHVNLDPRALLRMTARKRRALGNPGTNSAPDWLTAEGIKPLLIGQYNTREKWNLQLNLRREFAVVLKEKIEEVFSGMEEDEENSKIAAFVIRETPTKKACNTTLKNCRCCNSALAKFFDSIDLFGKTAKKENIEEKLNGIGGIEVSEEDVGIRSTKVCRKCFRKISGLGKAVHAFRDM